MEDANAFDLAYLKKHSLFGGITDEAFEHIKPLLRVARFPAGTVIVDEGTVNDRIYFIFEGVVEIVKRAATQAGEARHIALMHEGDTFGEMELIDVQPCAATVRAVEDTATLTLSNHDLYRISKVDMKTYALLLMNLAREISRRLRVTDDLIAQTELLHAAKNGEHPFSSAEDEEQ